jgi:hypothetical protein
MRLYLDDDSVDSALIRLLTAAGHDILIPAVAGTAGQEDAIHLMRSIQTNRSLMTRNYDDFKLLHDLVLFSGGHHLESWLSDETMIHLATCLTEPSFKR